MKFVILLSVLAFSFTSQALTEDYAFKCECTSTKKVCEGLENLNVAVKGNVLEGSMGSEDWEFNSAFTAKASKLALPVSTEKNTLRFDIENQSYNPDVYQNASVLVPNKALKKAKVLLIYKKTGKTSMAFDCVKGDPDYI